MKSSFKIALVVINIVLFVITILAGGFNYLYLPIFASLITLSIFKRDYVIWVFYAYMALNILMSPFSLSNILTLLNTILIGYCAWMNWTNMQGKTFSVYRDVSFRSTIILSAILQLISIIGLVFRQPSGLMLIANIITWLMSMGYFLAILAFTLRSIKCFVIFFIAALIQLIGTIVIGILLGGVNFMFIVSILLFLVYIGIVLIYQQQRH